MWDFLGSLSCGVIVVENIGKYSFNWSLLGEVHEKQHCEVQESWGLSLDCGIVLGSVIEALTLF